MQLAPREVQKLFDEHLQPHTRVNLRLTSSEIQSYITTNERTLSHALRSCAKWITKRAAENIYISRGGIMNSVESSVRYSTKDNVVPVPVDHTEELRKVFQDTLTSGEWTITEDEARAWLKLHDFSVLQDLFSAVDKKFTESEADDCIDLVSFRIETELNMASQ